MDSRIRLPRAGDGGDLARGQDNSCQEVGHLLLRGANPAGGELEGRTGLHAGFLFEEENLLRLNRTMHQFGSSYRLCPGWAAGCQHL